MQKQVKNPFRSQMDGKMWKVEPLSPILDTICQYGRTIMGFVNK